MRATLLYNPRSGTAETRDAVERGFAELGWKIHQCIDRSMLEDCLSRDVGDAVIVAGGDGTVGKIAKRLAGTDIPLVVLPTGTANNIARSLGIGVDCAAVIAGLEKYVERTIDLGTVWSRERGDEGFLEGFGAGVFAYVVGELATKRHKKLDKGLRLIADTLERYAPRAFSLEIDGRDLSGDYLLIAAMNVRSIGPVLGVAPRARMDDGLLDVVLVRPEAKRMLLSHLRRAADAGDIALPDFETHPAQRVRLRADGRWAHCDDLPRELLGVHEIGVRAAAVRVLVPSHTTAAT